jgi:signal transduction histidine kinase
MNEAVMVLDANYRVLDVNRRWHELTGYRVEDALGSRPESLPPAGTGDWLVQHKDGTDVPVLATMAAVPDADGRPRAYVATYVDIAERKRAEEALSRHAAELMRGNDQLREANARLETALASKNDKNTHRLIKMMNDLQLLFRLDTGSVTARRTPVPVREVVESVAADTPEDVRITVGEDLSALADRGHLTVVVQNLLTNALAYGEAPVEIRADRKADSVLLVVQDRGPGIPQDLVPRLFDRFMRGAGLGLFIVRHLVEANGGSVRYERAEPRGARLIVTLESASVSGSG